MTMTEVATELQHAAASLSAVCDGAALKDGHGFNKSDQSFGNYIAIVPPHKWDDETCYVVWEMLRKYRGQLTDHGIDYAELPRPQIKWEKGPKRGEVSKRMKAKAEREECLKVLKEQGVRAAIYKFKKQMIAVWNPTGVCFELYSPRNANLIAAIKSLPWKGRKWTGSCWTVSGPGLIGLKAILDEFDFIISDEDLTKLEGLIKAEHRLQEERKIEESKAHHLSIEGKRIVARTPYNASAISSMRNVQGRKWDPEKKVNTFPINIESARKIIDMADEFGWNFAPGVKEQLLDLEGDAKKKVEGSMALDAELEVDGLGDDTLKLRPFQRGGVAYAMKAKRTFIGDEMGLGKSIQAIGTVQAENAYPALFIIPSPVKLQFAAEARRWVPGKSVKIISGKQEQSYDADFVFINYDILASHEAALAKIEWKAIILDESHYIKNKKAARSMAAMALSALPSAKVRLCLTGTPVLNRPVEMVNQLAFLDRLDEFGGAWNFMKRYCDATRTKYGWDMSGASNLEELGRKLRASCFVRREKKDVAKELPPIQRTRVPIEIDRPEKYRDAVANVIEWLKDKKAEREGNRSFDQKAYSVEALAEIEGLKQIVVKHKLRGCVEWVKNFLDSDGKLVLFAHHRDVQEHLSRELKDYNPARISGGDGDERRAEEIEKFWTDDSCRVIVTSLKSGNVGLNLQVASNVAFVEFGWNPADMDQAEARVHRIGTEASNINSYWLYADGTFDNDIIDLIESKRAIVDAVTAGQELPEDVDIVSWFEAFAEKWEKEPISKMDLIEQDLDRH